MAAARDENRQIVPDHAHFETGEPLIDLLDTARSLSLRFAGERRRQRRADAASAPGKRLQHAFEK
jgi:hypothetical protein